MATEGPHTRLPDEETEYNTRVRAICSCGWRGPWRSKKAASWTYRDFHYDHLERVWDAKGEAAWDALEARYGRVGDERS